jgi:ornithine cyclodeaminase/alanine dehydrogenase-like protein (mu-crystallin family)
VPLYLTEQEVDELLTPAAAFAAVAASLRRDVVMPPRTNVAVPGGTFAVMAAADSELGFAGLKSYLWLEPLGAPFVVVLFSLEHATVEAVVEADILGRLRTAAASAVAATVLARSAPRTLGVFGTGRQAGSHVAALRAALPSLERVVAEGRDRQRVAAFCAEHRCEASEEPRDAGGCDIVVTATTSRDPVLRGEWLVPGALVIGVGANEPTARELDNVVLERASFVCTDSREQAKGEAGDLVEPIAGGVLDWLEVHELADVVRGEVTARASDDDVVVFKSNGIAAWDVAAAAAVVELARERGGGREL